MKIGILTQPLQNNYGGLLQNYALQTVLTELGHEVLTINVKYKNISLFRKSASILKRSLLKLLRHKILIRSYPTLKESEIISENTQQFVTRNIKTTKIIKQKVTEWLLNEYGFDSYIIGSDQVWRPKYSPQLSTYFLDFLKNNNTVKKLAYAASFGVNDWEFTQKQTQYLEKLIKLFDAVSVREDSAIDLCKKYFNVDASHLLDPTLLLDKEIYKSLVKKQDVKMSPGNLFTYILDESDKKDAIIKKTAQKYDLSDFSVMPNNQFSDPSKKNIQDCIFPPVEEWIRGFMDAEFVVTDSFHGTIFSIIFNKPFFAIANKNRGLTRFTSLLKLFNLEKRLVFSTDDINFDCFNEIDWEHINKILFQEKQKSLDFLISHLK
jgi:polysaccharide pyruvyl transferase WcaK-like protein